MKTPREILLARHQAATPKLDAIRQVAITNLNNKGTKEQSLQTRFVSLFLSCSDNFWQELIWPSRRIWAGLATVWILIVAANVSLRDHSEIKMAKSPPTREMILTYRQQEQLLTELIGPNDPPVAEPQKPYSPRPSSQRPYEIVTV